jgi:carboxyl-terminal processing protease
VKDYRSTTRDVRHLLKELKHQKIDGLVIDLRQNGGGSLQEAVELTGLFIKEGPVVQVRGTSGGIEVETDPDPALIYDGPLAVLVDRFSASASEIFAGAIQDYGRGLVIGDPTYGKGTVQTLINLNRFIPDAMGPLGQLKLTIAKFYRINGSSTQHRGVTPDITFPSVFDQSEVGESAEEYALPWDKIKPIYYQHSSNLDDLIPELRRRHQVRMTSDITYREWQKDIEAAKQAREKTTVSLLKSKREAEWEKTKASQRKWENRYRISRGLKPLGENEDIPEHDGADGPDLLLEEGTRIIADLIDLLDQHKDHRTFVMTDEK